MNADFDNLKWWVLLGHRIITFLSGLGAVILLWLDRLEKAEEKIKWFEHHIERRTHMNTQLVMTGIGFIQKFLPYIESGISEIAPFITEVMADGGAAVTAVLKVFNDFKAAIDKVKADVAAKASA